MTCKEIMKTLEAAGHESTKAIYMRHGGKEPLFGVKVADLKKILKKTKKNHELSLELYATGNSDAMYLAGLMADETKISKAQLQKWVKQAYWSYLCEYTVPWVASETPYGKELGLKWIESKNEQIASAGWGTMSNRAALLPDDVLDKKLYKGLLKRVAKDIHKSQNRVRFVMNGFVIAVGGYIPSLNEEARKVAEKIGKVAVEMGGTACKVPLATTYIQKMVDRGTLGRKRKTARC